MMTAWQLNTALWTIALLRREEVEAGGMTPLGDDAAWESFDSDRFGWCMRNFDKMNEVWRAVRRYVPADYPAAPPEPAANVIEIPGTFKSQKEMAWQRKPKRIGKRLKRALAQRVRSPCLGVPTMFARARKP